VSDFGQKLSVRVSQNLFRSKARNFYSNGFGQKLSIRISQNFPGQNWQNFIQMALDKIIRAFSARRRRLISVVDSVSHNSIMEAVEKDDSF